MNTTEPVEGDGLPLLAAGRWRLLHATELSLIVSSAGLEIDAPSHDSLLSSINEQIRFIGGMRGALRATSPSAIAKDADEVRRTSMKLRKLLARREVSVALERQYDQKFDLKGDPIKPRKMNGITALTRALKLRYNSDQARALTQHAIGLLHLVEDLAEAAKAHCQSVSKDKSRPALVQLLKLHRLALVQSLAELFETHFGEPPLKTRDGAWCRFLAGVMSHSEDKELGCDGAYELWLEASPAGGSRQKKKAMKAT